MMYTPNYIYNSLASCISIALTLSNTFYKLVIISKKKLYTTKKLLQGKKYMLYSILCFTAGSR